MKKNIGIFLILLIITIVLILAISILLCKSKQGKDVNVIDNFWTCMEAGYPVMESYPRQCRIPQGELFVEDIGNEIEKSDLIIINSPRPNQVVSSPLLIEGRARGFWFFEGDFPVYLLDKNNNRLGVAIAQAQGEWMTEEFVPFEAKLEFSKPETNWGTLILKKDNPSDLSENDDELQVPIIFQ